MTKCPVCHGPALHQKAHLMGAGITIDIYACALCCPEQCDHIFVVNEKDFILGQQQSAEVGKVLSSGDWN